MKKEKLATSNIYNLVDTFEAHWITTLENISSPALVRNWTNNFIAFDRAIHLNRSDKPSKKICCPSPTGSGKTQQAIHQAIALASYDVATLIVTMRTEDADLIASQIAASTHEGYVGVHHSKEVSIEGVTNVEDTDDAQCLIITHEMFRRQQDTLTEGRDLIIIDEAIDVITHYQIEELDLKQMLQIIDAKRNLDYEDKKEELLLEEERILQTTLDTMFKAMHKINKEFAGYRSTPVPIEDEPLKNLQFKELKKLLEDPSIKPSAIMMGYQNDHIDDAVKKKLIDICDNILYFFRQFAYLTKNGNRISWSTAKELVPGKTIVVMDATASVNKAYEFYQTYQEDKLEILPSVECRDYTNVKLYTARTHTGRFTILASEKSKGTKAVNKTARTLTDMIMKDTKPGDDILVVTFKELEPLLLMLIASTTDRRIRVDHWGNLTGTNKYNTCNKCFIYGLNHKPKEVHRSLHALIKSPVESFRDTEENKAEFNALITSDIVAEVIQAINRVRCRNVIDDKGNCEPVDVYLTLPAHFSSAQEMMIAIKSEMHNIQELEWTYAKKNIKTVERGAFLESFMVQLGLLLNDKKFEVKLADVLDALQLNKKQWTNNIKSHKLFEATLDNAGFMMEMRYSYSRRDKVKSKNPNTPWFFRK